MANSIVSHSRRYSLRFCRQMRSTNEVLRRTLPENTAQGRECGLTFTKKTQSDIPASAFNETAFRGEETSLEEIPCQRLKINFSRCRRGRCRR